MRLHAVLFLLATLAFCSALSPWTPPTTATPSGAQAAKDLFAQFNFQTNPGPSQESNQDPNVCYTENQDEGKCVKTSMCALPPPEISPNFIYRTGPSNQPGNKCKFLLICCPEDKIIKNPVPPTPSTPPGCGYSNPAVGRFRQLTDSGYADFAEFPWMVALLKNSRNNPASVWNTTDYLGGGTLIHPSVVITVAHKVDTMASTPSDTLDSVLYIIHQEKADKRALLVAVGLLCSLVQYYALTGLRWELCNDFKRFQFPIILSTNAKQRSLGPTQSSVSSAAYGSCIGSFRIQLVIVKTLQFKLKVLGGLNEKVGGLKGLKAVGKDEAGDPASSFPSASQNFMEKILGQFIFLLFTQLKCRAGEWETENENESYEHQDREVLKIIVHEQFDKPNFYYDVALLIMETPFLLKPHINVACLSQTMPPPGTLCSSMGWGMDFTKGTHNANVLKKIPMPLMSKHECERVFRKSNLGPSYFLHRSLTCAGGVPTVDTCTGDGGSPLVCPVGDPSDLRYTVVGMVTYGSIPCGLEFPNAYAKIPELYSWVNQRMSMEGFYNMPYSI